MSATTFTVTSTEELYDALSQAVGGDRIELAAGEYALNLSSYSAFDVTYDAPVTITSADPGNAAKFSEMNLSGVSNLTIDNVVFDYTFSEGDQNWNHHFKVNGSNTVRILNSVFDGDVASGLGTAADGYGYSLGLSVRGSSDIQISGNEFKTWWSALSAMESERVTVSENEIHSVRSDGVRLAQVENIVIEDNYIHDFVASLESNDHRDMIQMWSTNTTAPSKHVIIRSNTLDVGKGDFTQSIFMRNELVDRGISGAEMFYQDILIEENLILNAHSAGISVGETDGLIIRRNSVLSVEDPELVPRIKVAGDSKNVTIEQNAAAGISGFTDQADWTVADNAVVQNHDPNAAGYYEAEFLTSSMHGGVEDFIVDPNGSITKLEAGASRLQLDTTPETLVPAFDVRSDPDDAGVLIFDATHSYGPQGQITEADATFSWEFGDATGATGPRVQCAFETAGAHPVTLTVTLADGTSAATQGTIAVPGLDVLRFNPETGGFAAEGFGQVSEIEGTDAASLAFSGQQALDLGGSGTSLSIPREYLDRFFGTEDFTLSMTIAADTPGTAGEVLRLHNSFILSVTEGGDVRLQLWTESDTLSLPTSSAVAVNDGQAHDISVAFDGATDTVQIIVDGRVEATATIDGAMPSMGSWDLVFGNPWGGQNFDGKLMAFELDAAARLYPEFEGDVSAIPDTTFDLSSSQPDSSDGTSTDEDTSTGDDATGGEEDPDPSASDGEDSGSLIPDLGGYELDFAALASDVSSLRGDAFVTSDTSDRYAVVFDGESDYVTLGRLVDYESAEALTVSVTFQRDNPDGDYERLFWNHQKLGIGVLDDALIVQVGSPDQSFSTPFRIDDLGLDDTYQHTVIVAIDEVTDRLQVILDGQIVYDAQDTDLEISEVGAPQWMLGTPINPGFEGSVSDLQLQAEALFVEDGIFIA